MINLKVAYNPIKMDAVSALRSYTDLDRPKVCLKIIIIYKE